MVCGEILLPEESGSRQCIFAVEAMMEAFQMQNDGKRIYFRNLNRIPSGEELAEVMKRLQVAGFGDAEHIMEIFD